MFRGVMFLARGGLALPATAAAARGPGSRRAGWRTSTDHRDAEREGRSEREGDGLLLPDRAHQAVRRHDRRRPRPAPRTAVGGQRPGRRPRAGDAVPLPDRRPRTPTAPRSAGPDVQDEGAAARRDARGDARRRSRPAARRAQRPAHRHEQREPPGRAAEQRVPVHHGLRDVGTPVVTDADGTFSFNGLRSREHAVPRADAAPAGDREPDVVVGAAVQVRTVTRRSTGPHSGRVRFSGSITPATDGAQHGRPEAPGRRLDDDRLPRSKDTSTDRSRFKMRVRLYRTGSSASWPTPSAGQACRGRGADDRRQSDASSTDDGARGVQQEARRVADVVDVDALVAVVDAGLHHLQRGDAGRPEPHAVRAPAAAHEVGVHEPGADGREQRRPGSCSARNEAQAA